MEESVCRPLILYSVYIINFVIVNFVIIAFVRPVRRTWFSAFVATFRSCMRYRALFCSWCITLELEQIEMGRLFSREREIPDQPFLKKKSPN